MNSGKTADLIKMLFVFVGQVSTRSSGVLDWVGPDPPIRGIFGFWGCRNGLAAVQK